MYINISESYLWTPRRIQTYGLCHSGVGFSEVVPLLLSPRSQTSLSGFSSAAIVETKVLKLNAAFVRHKGNSCTAVLSSRPPPRGRSDGTTQWMCNDLQWGLLMTPFAESLCKCVFLCCVISPHALTHSIFTVEVSSFLLIQMSIITAGSVSWLRLRGQSSANVRSASSF